MANEIDESHEQVVYDVLFMSESEFGLVYGELYPTYTLRELKDIFYRIVDGASRGEIKYNRGLKRTRLSSRSSGDLRIATGGPRHIERPERKKKSEEPVKTPKGSLKDEIIKLHVEGQTKSQIRDNVGCKYQYVFQTVKKYEESL